MAHSRTHSNLEGEAAAHFDSIGPDAIAQLQQDLRQLQEEITHTLAELDWAQATHSARPSTTQLNAEQQLFQQHWVTQFQQTLSPRLQSLIQSASGPLHPLPLDHLAQPPASLPPAPGSSSRDQHNSLHRPVGPAWQRPLAGLALVTSLALAATVLNQLPGLGFLSPLILAVILGMLVKNFVGTPSICQAGITFSLKRILRLAIILLGLRLSLGQLVQVGPTGLFLVVATLASTFMFTCWLGRQMGISPKLTQLIAAGTSICGASAVVATNTVVDGRDEDVAYAVTVVTVFGTLSMLLYPVLAAVLSLSPEAFGIWSGASIHEVAQVVAAAFQGGAVSGELATVVKLSRVLFLVPIMLTLGAISMHSRRTPHSGSQASAGLKLHQLPIPWFVFGFIVLMVLNSLNLFPVGLKENLIDGNKFLLTIALAAMGLETNFLKMKQTGLKPLYLGAAAWIFISLFSLSLLKMLY